MRVFHPLLASSLAVVALALPLAAGAQTCAAPQAWQTDQSGQPALAGTTCGHEAGIVSVCQGGFTAPGQAYIATVGIADAGTFTTITFGGGGGYTISAYLVPIASGCNADAACTTVGDASTPMLHADIPEGQYFLILTGADFDAAGSCGPFTATPNGTLPVELRTFTIE